MSSKYLTNLSSYLAMILHSPAKGPLTDLNLVGKFRIALIALFNILTLLNIALMPIIISVIP